jgi:hypothetical protein
MPYSKASFEYGSIWMPYIRIILGPYTHQRERAHTHIKTNEPFFNTEEDAYILRDLNTYALV